MLASLLVAVLLLTVTPLASLSEIDLSGVTDWFSSTAQAAFDPSTLKIPGYNDYENVRYYVNKDHTASFIKIIDPSKVSGTYNIHSFGPFKITYINTYAFANCTNVTYVGIPDTVVGIGYSAFNDTAYYKDESNWTNGVLYNGTYLLGAKTSLSGTYNVIDGTTCIAGNAFVNCTELTGITLPESLKYISQQAFWKSGLKSVTLPNSLQRVSDRAFADCTGTAVISLSKNLETIGISAFENCKYLVIMDFPKSLKNISEKAFKGCTELTKIVIPTTVNSVYDEAFLNCTSLKSVTIGKGVSSIGAKAFGYYNDGKCDRCEKDLRAPSEPEKPSESSCSCACHKSGIENFFFKIILFFQRIFGTNKVCKCGASHY